MYTWYTRVDALRGFIIAKTVINTAWMILKGVMVSNKGLVKQGKGIKSYRTLVHYFKVNDSRRSLQHK